MKLIATQPLTHQGRSIAAGEVFEASGGYAVLYRKRKQAIFARDQRAEEPVAVTEPVRRRYRRRDLQAED